MMLRVKHCVSAARNTRDAIRNALNLILLVCILTTCLGISGCRSGGIRVRSWEEAIQFVQIELAAADNPSASGSRQSLEDRLDAYAQTAARLSAQIVLLDQARPALELINRLHEFKVPLIGNGWQILLFLLGMATVDGAKIIGKLEEILRELTELKSSLDELVGLPAVADAVRDFRAEPSPRTLGALADHSAGTTPSMRRLHADLGEVSEPLKDVADNISGLVGGLRSAAVAGVPVVSDAARVAAERIGPIEEPLLALRDGLDQLHQGIGTDTEVLERIQEAVRQAREHAE
jgi:hypothetical protein